MDTTAAPGPDFIARLSESVSGAHSLEELVRPRQRPVTNVVAMVVVLVTFLPILAAYYLTREGDQVSGSGK